MQGQSNSDLNDLGRQQADVNGRMLAELDIQALYASPLDRTRQTTQIIQRHVPLDAVFDPRIMEWNCGEWSGQLYEDVKIGWADEWAALQADRFNYRGPGCENYPDMIARATPFLRELMASSAENIAVVSHGMIGRVMVGILMGFCEADMLRFAQPNDVVYRVSIGHGETEPPRLDHFAGGDGPIPGLIERGWG